MFGLWERWGAGLGVLGVVLWVIAFLVDSDSPSADDSDAKIQAFFASSSDRHREIVAFFVFVVGALCVISFFGALRERLADAQDSPARISQLPSVGLAGRRCKSSRSRCSSVRCLPPPTPRLRTSRRIPSGC